MTTKSLTVTEEAYERLKAHKRADESFSDLLDRVTDREADFEAGVGALAEVDFDGAPAELDDRFEEAFGR